MTQSRNRLKDATRARAAETNEPYSLARRHVLEERQSEASEENRAKAGGVRTLGIHGTSKALYLALVERGQVLNLGPQKIEVPDGLRTSSSLDAFGEECRRRLREASAAAAGLLLPSSYTTPTATLARISAETIFRYVAAELGIEVELLARPTARARLGWGAKGRLDDVLAEQLPSPTGKYWSERRYAALAALAAEVGS
jgi:hypothetical protein